jgi:hypothetical protein
MSDDVVTGVKISTMSSKLCTVILGFSSDELTTTIAVKSLNPVTVRGADRWKCITNENTGLDCGPNRTFEHFDPLIVASVINTSVTFSGEHVEGEYHDVDLSSLADIFDFSDIGNNIEQILIGLAIVLAVLAVIVVLWKCRKHICHTRTTDDDGLTEHQEDVTVSQL